MSTENHSPEAIEQSVRAFIASNFVVARAKGPLEAAQSLMDSGIVDSTGVLELTGFLESEFGIQIADADLIPENLDSVASIVAFVVRKSGGTP